MHDDPEAFFMFAAMLVRLGFAERSLEVLGRVVDGGFAALPSLESDPGWEPLRASPRFQELVGRARDRRALARAAYREAGGERPLGV